MLGDAGAHRPRLCHHRLFQEEEGIDNEMVSTVRNDEYTDYAAATSEGSMAKS